MEILVQAADRSHTIDSSEAFNIVSINCDRVTVRCKATSYASLGIKQQPKGKAWRKFRPPWRMCGSSPGTAENVGGLTRWELIRSTRLPSRVGAGEQLFP